MPTDDGIRADNTLTDLELLERSREFRNALTADDNRLARELGISQGEIDDLDASIATLERSIEDERQATLRMAATGKAMEQFADKLIAAIDDLERSQTDTSKDKGH